METKIINENYCRVIPRDLFNEAKLLKCMGRLALLELDNMAPKTLSILDNGEPFRIGQIEYDGSITITNWEVRIKGEPHIFKTSMNSKYNYPLYVETDEDEIEVFNEQGELTKEFINYCK